jgi:hypothetical protein
MIKLTIATVAALTIATPALAQAAAPCELHVWSTDKIKAYVSGWSVALGGGALGGLLDGKLPADKAIQVILTKAMERPFQAEALKQLDLPRMLALPAVEVIAEQPLAAPTAWKKTSGRLTASGSTCYAELIVRDLYFEKSAMFKPNMRVNFTYRFFGGKTHKPDIMEGRGGTDMLTYPLVSTQDVDKIITDFQRTYALDFIEFVNDQHKAGRIKGAMPPLPPALVPPPPPSPAA